MGTHAASLRVALLAVLVTLALPGTASATPTLVGASSARADASQTVSFAKPAGVAAGDVMVAQVMNRGSAAITAPSGWTTIRDTFRGSSTHMQTWFKVATASEPASYAFSSSNAFGKAGGIAAWRGVDTAAPIDASSGNEGSGSSMTALGVTTSSADSPILWMGGYINGTTISPPSGMTERWDVAATGQYKATAESSDLVQGIAGATGNKVGTAGTSSGGGWMTQLIALRAAPSCTTALLDLRVDGCVAARVDTAPQLGLDPIPLWGYSDPNGMQVIDCENNQRHQWLQTGGDPHLMGNGSAQGDQSFRRLTTIYGDTASPGRCELGRNEWRYGEVGGTSSPSGTFALYAEGDHRVTFLSVRLPSNYPLDSTSSFANVMQMKQTQPSDNGGGTPALHLNAHTTSSGPSWVLRHSAPIASGSSEIWRTPAQVNVWTRFAFDVSYSKDPSVGKVEVYVDLNGDGDARDPSERSPQFQTNTLKQEIAGTDADGIREGDPIPSHLRIGIYGATTPSSRCPSPGGCSIEVDNVQVFDLP